MKSEIKIEFYFPAENAERHEYVIPPFLASSEELLAQLFEICANAPYAPSHSILKQSVEHLFLPREHASSGLVVALERERILGFVQFRVILDAAELDYIAVRSDARGAGVAQLLMQALIEQTKLHRVQKILLEVGVKNLAARSLYEKFLFAQIGKREKYYSGVEDALVMEKVL